MQRVRLFHWNADEAAPVVDTLQRAGFQVEYDSKPNPQILRTVRQTPPEAVIIDLSRLPSHGREIATALRGNQHSRQIPILFLDGAPEKIEAVRQVLPDAAYCARPRLLTALRKCLRTRPENPVIPTQMMDRYAGRTTAQKLGITRGMKVAVVDAPRDYAHVIGTLPDEVEFDEENWQGCPVTLWFFAEPDAYLGALPVIRRAAATSKTWIAWPKKSARRNALLNENIIREMALENGLVDYKVCSLNPTWSGLCLSLRKSR